MKAIVAMTPSRVIGCGNTIPWKIPGEQNYLSIGRLLPGRRNLIVSRSQTWEGAEMIRDLSQFDPANYQEEVYVIGGAEVYQQLVGRCAELLITRLKAEYPGDVYFPEYESEFSIVELIRETPDYWIFRYAHQLPR
jgi:dihydrofolate reductase